jgi:NADH:ubiquinone oxidoreductase subunit K
VQDAAEAKSANGSNSLRKLRKLIEQYCSLSLLQKLAILVLLTLTIPLGLIGLCRSKDNLDAFSSTTLIIEGIGIAIVCFRGFRAQGSTTPEVGWDVFLLRAAVMVVFLIWGGWGWIATYGDHNAKGVLMPTIGPLTVLLPALSYGLSKAASWNVAIKSRKGSKAL